MRLRPAILGFLLTAVCVGGPASAQSAQDLRVGNWIEVKGAWDGVDRFTAQSVEALPPAEEEVLLGDVTNVAPDGTSFTVLGQVVQISEKTNWIKLGQGELPEARVKVTGHYRGPRKFSSRSVASRDGGRDRLQGRIDGLRRVDSGYEVLIMRYSVLVPDTLEVEAEEPLADLALAPAIVRDVDTRERDEDDYVPVTHRLWGDVYVGATLEWTLTEEDNYNLDKDEAEDRLDNRFTLRGEAVWLYSDRFYGLGRFRHSTLFRDDQDASADRTGDTRVSEAFGYWSDVGVRGLDLQVGRQDFDEGREWIYDQNLDAARLIYEQPSYRLEVSASTTLSDGRPRDEDSTNFIGYLTNNDEDRLLAAYVIDRRDDSSADDNPIHFGVRALGDWIPENESWAEFSVLRGYEDDIDLESYGFDVGTTWFPSFASPMYFSAGYAFGSGDKDTSNGTDKAFRQTGFQDNNAKLGGVTSFRYYGELVDPELSNMGILTLGVGTRIGKRNSLDLVYHRFVQDEPTDFLRDTDLDRRPNGDDDDLGWELDLIFGSRSLEKWDFEIVGGMFEPGDAFDQDDMAYLAKVQVRFQF